MISPSETIKTYRLTVKLPHILQSREVGLPKTGHYLYSIGHMNSKSFDISSEIGNSVVRPNTGNHISSGYYWCRYKEYQVEWKLVSFL